MVYVYISLHGYHSHHNNFNDPLKEATSTQVVSEHDTQSNSVSQYDFQLTFDLIMC